MFPHTVTLYHTQENGGNAVTVRRGVLVETVKASSVSTRGHEGADGPRLYVPFAVAAVDGPTGHPQQYAGPVAYENALDKSGLWTLPVDGTAFFIKGEVVEPVMDRQELEASHDGVYSVVSVVERDFGPPELQHWEIGGA